MLRRYGTKSCHGRLIPRDEVRCGVWYRKDGPKLGLGDGEYISWGKAGLTLTLTVTKHNRKDQNLRKCTTKHPVSQKVQSPLGNCFLSQFCAIHRRLDCLLFAHFLGPMVEKAEEFGGGGTAPDDLRTVFFFFFLFFGPLYFVRVIHLHYPANHHPISPLGDP